MARFPGWRRWLSAAPGHARDALVDLAATTQAEMRAQAPWTDRSAKARRSLTATVETRAVPPAGRTFTLILGYDDRVILQNPRARGVNYGRFLEDTDAGRHAVVRPTAERLRRVIGPRLERAVRAG